jgi:hypothetical protein
MLTIREVSSKLIKEVKWAVVEYFRPLGYIPKVIKWILNLRINNDRF